MRYTIKGELEVKVGDSALLPGGCDFHIGAVLTDESMALVPWQAGFLPCLEPCTSPQLLPFAKRSDWW